jgi:hypothetical protein
MAGVVVLDVADDIRARLGAPTVTALARRFGPAGRCLTCGAPFGAVPLSVRAYHGLDGITTLVAYHADCAASAWLAIGPGILPQQDTWSAAMTSTQVRMAVPRALHQLRGPGTQDLVMPVLLVHPSLDRARARQVGPGEAVNADVEDYSGLGFADPGTAPAAGRLRPAGRARIQETGDDARLEVTVTGRIWSAPVSPPDATLAAGRGGIVVGITCDSDPGRLAADPAQLEHVIATGGVLLGWAPLRG